VTVRKATTCIREYLWAFKGTVGVLSVASGRSDSQLLSRRHSSFRFTGSGRIVTLPTSTPIRTGVTVMLDCPAPLVYAVRKFTGIAE